MPPKTKQCPCCGKVKNIEKDFGFRSGNNKPQSWCRLCRGTGKIKSQIEREKAQSQPRSKRLVKDVKVRFLTSEDVEQVIEQKTLMSGKILVSELDHINNLSDGIIQAAAQSKGRVQVFCESTANGAAKDRTKWALDQERAALRKLYAERYPGGTCTTRSINFMRKKLKLEKWS